MISDQLKYQPKDSGKLSLVLLMLVLLLINTKISAKNSDIAPDAGPAAMVQQDTYQPVLFQVMAEEWELARSGETIMALPSLKQVIGQWLHDRQKRIEIRYPGGEEGEFWLQQLTDWLVALGIPSDRMLISPGSGADDIIILGLVK